MRNIDSNFMWVVQWGVKRLSPLQSGVLQNESGVQHRSSLSSSTAVVRRTRCRSKRIFFTFRMIKSDRQPTPRLLKVRPYYLHHPDLAPDTSQFRVPIEVGQEQTRVLRG